MSAALIWDEANRTRSQRVSYFGETKHTWKKTAHAKSLRSQKSPVASRLLPGGACPAPPGCPGRTQGSPRGGWGRVTEERRPSSKTVRFGTYNPARKMLTPPQNNLGNGWFLKMPGRQRAQPGTGRNLPQSDLRALLHSSEPQPRPVRTDQAPYAPCLARTFLRTSLGHRDSSSRLCKSTP